jgi:hypothetical protein
MIFVRSMSTFKIQISNECQIPKKVFLGLSVGDQDFETDLGEFFGHG